MQYDGRMPRSKIHETLSTLHEQLRDQSAFDDADRTHLREVLSDIEAALEADQIGDNIGERVKQTVAAFEVKHPTIATALHGLMESLSKL